MKQKLKKHDLCKNGTCYYLVKNVRVNGNVDLIFVGSSLNIKDFEFIRTHNNIIPDILKFIKHIGPEYC